MISEQGMEIKIFKVNFIQGPSWPGLHRNPHLIVKILALCQFSEWVGNLHDCEFSSYCLLQLLPPGVQDIQELCLSVDMELHDVLFVLCGYGGVKPDSSFFWSYTYNSVPPSWMVFGFADRYWPNNRSRMYLIENTGKAASATLLILMEL